MHQSTFFDLSRLRIVTSHLWCIRRTMSTCALKLQQYQSQYLPIVFESFLKSAQNSILFVYFSALALNVSTDISAVSIITISALALLVLFPQANSNTSIYF